jgi:RNA polymerase sigma-70 factor (ECF subfamily)
MAEWAMELVLGPWLASTGEGAPPAPDADAALMARYGQGDVGAFDELYRRHRAPLYRTILRLAPGRADADEIFQEVWMAVIQGRARYTPTARFTTFLFSIAHRRIADRLRQAARRPRAEMPEDVRDGAPGPLAQAENAALAAALGRAVAALSHEHREAYLLRVEGELSVEEIAAVTRVPFETAKSRLRAANRALREKLGDWQ